VRSVQARDRMKYTAKALAFSGRPVGRLPREPDAEFYLSWKMANGRDISSRVPVVHTLVCRHCFSGEPAWRTSRMLSNSYAVGAAVNIQHSTTRGSRRRGVCCSKPGVDNLSREVDNEGGIFRRGHICESEIFAESSDRREQLRLRC
jgi:hypothetical protein